MRPRPVRARRSSGSRRQRRLRARRAFAAVIFAAGLLLVAETAVTLAWQEPLSALQAKRHQKQLARELDRVERAALAAAPRRHPGRAAGYERRALGRLAASLRRRAAPGQPLGRIVIPKLGVRFVVVQGTDAESLKRGPAHYPRTVLPGERGTVGIAGHRTTYLAPFRHIDALDRGDYIVLQMPYGRFHYRVQRTSIVPPSAVHVLRTASEDRLVLTSCHPLFSAAKRIVVFARLAASFPRGDRRDS